MGVAILNAQDCLRDTSFSRQPLISPSKPSSRNPNRASRARAQPNRRKRSPPRPTNDLDAGRVTILKRGDKIASPAPATTGLLGTRPGSAPTLTKIAEPDGKTALFYAGSAFFTSPPPSSVPLPAFFTVKTAGDVTSSDDDATSGLRRLLRLDLQ